MKIKEKLSVSTLEGEKLAEWAARAQGLELNKMNAWTKNGKKTKHGYKWQYRPDINGGQAMELAKKFKIGISYNEETNTWFADALVFTEDDNPEPAICRAVVYSEYGEYVDDK